MNFSNVVHNQNPNFLKQKRKKKQTKKEKTEVNKWEITRIMEGEKLIIAQMCFKLWATINIQAMEKKEHNLFFSPTLSLSPILCRHPLPLPKSKPDPPLFILLFLFLVPSSFLTISSSPFRIQICLVSFGALNSVWCSLAFSSMKGWFFVLPFWRGDFLFFVFRIRAQTNAKMLKVMIGISGKRQWFSWGLKRAGSQRITKKGYKTEL